MCILRTCTCTCNIRTWQPHTHTHTHTHTQRRTHTHTHATPSASSLASQPLAYVGEKLARKTSLPQLYFIEPWTRCFKEWKASCATLTIYLSQAKAQTHTYTSFSKTSSFLIATIFSVDFHSPRYTVPAAPPAMRS